MPEALVPDAVSRAIRRALRRLVPFLMLMYVVSFLDRANVAFAKQALAATEGISEQVYALGAGLFFLSYSTCGFPSNLILHRPGARRWLGALLIAWGLVSTSTMFVTGPASFCALRLLLGVTEAGFFPGVILYLTYWFPKRVRGRMMGLFYLRGQAHGGVYRAGRAGQFKPGAATVWICELWAARPNNRRGRRTALRACGEAGAGPSSPGAPGTLNRCP